MTGIRNFRIRILVGIIVFLSLAGGSAIAQKNLISGDSLLVFEKTLKKINKNFHFTIIPGPTGNSSTQFGFAILPMFVYDINQSDTLSPPSSTSALFFFNLYGSWLVALQQSLFWDDNKWRAVVSIGFGDLRSKYFGVYNGTELINNKDYSWMDSREAIVTVTCYRKIYSGLFGGLEFLYHYVGQKGDDSLASEKMKADGVVVGDESLTLFIPTFVWDNRDNIFWSTKGFYARLNIHTSRIFFGSSRDFAIINGFVCGYHKLLKHNDRLILAWRFQYQESWGNVPYFWLSNYGYGDNVRGYTSGKYVNYSKMNLQAELRFDVWKFINLAGFVSIGKVFGHLSDFGSSIWLPSTGLTLYLNVIPSQKIRAWITGAIGNGDWGVYVGLKQAF